MTHAANLPAWAAVVTALLLLLGSMLALIGSLGLLRFRSFYDRVHAPTLGSTLGTVFIAAASMISTCSIPAIRILSGPCEARSIPDCTLPQARFIRVHRHGEQLLTTRDGSRRRPRAFPVQSQPSPETPS